MIDMGVLRPDSASMQLVREVIAANRKDIS